MAKKIKVRWKYKDGIEKTKVRREHKDGLFVDMFGETANFLDLYHVCTGRRLGEGEVTPFDLRSSVLNRHSENDVSFLKSDNKLIILVEHQSSPNPNMPLREFMYYNKLLELWLKRADRTTSETACIDMPLPEFFVAYIGEKPFNEERLEVECESMRITVKLVDINFDNLKDQRPEGMLAGYSYFQKQFRLKKAEGASSEDSFEHAVGQCKKDGYLKGVVDKEDFIVKYRYKPLYSREDELWYERGLEMLEIAIKAGASGEILLKMIKEGFRPGEADALSRQLQAGQLAIQN